MIKVIRDLYHKNYITVAFRKTHKSQIVMEQLDKGNEQYLLEPGLENLHEDSVRWNSELELWKRELSFFQKLLDSNSSKIVVTDDKKKEDHFQNIIIYYDGELIPEYKQACRRHEKYLAQIMSGDEDVNESEYRRKHHELKNKIESLESEFTKYKHEFFEFIEKVM